MREILFKAKRIDNGEWVEGYVVRKHGLYFIYDIVNSETCRQNNYEVDPGTICQFTGLCDIYGNKIWENDIVQYGAVAATVKFGEYGNGNLGFYVDFPEETNYRKDFAYWAKKVVVVGNVSDNPELLQEVPE